MDAFIGRQKELAILDQLWDSNRAQLLILYGRRRVGKTALLTHWIRETGRRALYWVATPDSALAQLRSFSQAVYNFANPEAPAPESFTYASWEQAWQEVARLAEQERLALSSMSLPICSKSHLRLPATCSIFGTTFSKTATCSL